MSVTYDDVLAGLHARFATVEGLDAEHILDYAPDAIEPITLFSMFESWSGEEKTQVAHDTYRTRHYLCFQWQDNEQAEVELRPYIQLIPASVRADPHLNHLIDSGWAKITEVVADFITIGGILYRTLEFVSEVLVKSPVVRS